MRSNLYIHCKRTETDLKNVKLSFLSNERKFIGSKCLLQKLWPFKDKHSKWRIYSSSVANVLIEEGKKIWKLWMGLETLKMDRKRQNNKNFWKKKFKFCSLTRWLRSSFLNWINFIDILANIKFAQQSLYSLQTHWNWLKKRKIKFSFQWA